MTKLPAPKSGLTPTLYARDLNLATDRGKVFVAKYNADPGYRLNTPNGSSLYMKTNLEVMGYIALYYAITPEDLKQLRGFLLEIPR